MDDVMPPALSAGSQQAVDLLSRLLAEARAGKIQGLAVVLPRGGQVEVLVAGAAGASDLYFGGGILQHRVLEMVAPGGARNPSSLIRVA